MLAPALPQPYWFASAPGGWLQESAHSAVGVLRMLWHGVSPLPTPEKPDVGDPEPGSQALGPRVWWAQPCSTPQTQAPRVHPCLLPFAACLQPQRLALVLQVMQATQATQTLDPEA